MLTLLVAGQPLVVRSAESTQVSLKKKYEAAVREIESEHDAKQASLLGVYSDALDRAIEALRRKRDPAPVVSAKTEKQRFEKEKSVPNPPADGLPPMLQDVQAQYHKLVEGAEKQKAEQTISRTRSYIAALDALMGRLTSEDKLDQAMVVRQEKTRVEFILADAEARLPKSEEKPGRKQQAVIGARPIGKLPAKLTEGLVLYYDFNSFWKPKVRDLSGRGNHGQNHGATWNQKARGLRNGAYEFDGRGDYIHIDIQLPDLRVSPPSTLALWIRPKNDSARCLMSVGHRDKVESEVPEDYEDLWLLVVGNGASNTLRDELLTLGWGIHSERQGYTTKVRDELYDGEWHHVVLVSDSSYSLYLDANRKRLTIGGGGDRAYSPRGDLIWLGKNPYPTSRKKTFHGAIDEVMMWNRALTDDEVKQLYELQKGK